jgi:hypothetical protein
MRLHTTKAGGHLSWVLAILIAAVYVRYFWRCSEGMQIIQLPLARCTPELLGEKRPVVITDRLANHADLVGTLFRWSHVYASAAARVPPGQVRRSMARYAILYDAESDVAVDIAHPEGGATWVSVKLRRHQTLVLPPRWRFVAPSGCTSIRLYDPFYAVASSLFAEPEVLLMKAMMAAV